MFLKYKTIYNTVKKERNIASSSSSILGLRRTNTNQSNKIMCIVVTYFLLVFVHCKGFTTPQKKRKITKILNLSAPFFPVSVPYNVNSAEQKIKKKEEIYLDLLSTIYI